MRELEREGKGEPWGTSRSGSSPSTDAHISRVTISELVSLNSSVLPEDRGKEVNYGPSNFKAATFSGSSNGLLLPVTGANIGLPSVLNSGCHNCYIS